MSLPSRHQKTLDAVRANPIRSDVKWDNVVSLIQALGGSVSERSGSRTLFLLNGKKGVFHRPHPKPEIDKGALRDIRDFIDGALEG